MAILTSREIERRLARLVAELRESCDGELPEDFDLHLEDIGHALGLSDEDLRRVLAVDLLPSERPLGLRLPAELEASMAECRDRNDHAGAMAAARAYYERVTGEGQA